MKNKETAIHYERIGNPNGDVLIVVDKITESKNYQYFHNSIHYRKSNKEIIFHEDFLIIESSDLIIENNNLAVLISQLPVIILACEKNINSKLIEKIQNLKPLKEPEWKRDEFSIWMDTNKSKVLFVTEDFQDLTLDILEQISSDIKFISIIENLSEDIYSKIKKNIIYYQFECINCNKFNLSILHKTEPVPDICEKCNKYASGIKDKLPRNTLILKNNKLKKTT